MTIGRYDVDSAFAQRQLRQIRSQIINKDYPELAWDRFVPMEPGVNPGADTFAHQEMDSVGDAKVTTTYADDVPLVDVMLTESANGIVGLTSGYKYSIQDMRKSQMSGMDLPGRKGVAARDRLERKLAEVVSEGSADHGVGGFINNAAVTAANVANPGAGTEWANKSPDERVADIQQAVEAILDATEGIEGNLLDIILPPKQFFMLSGYRLGQTEGDGMTTTALSFIQSSIPNVRSVSMWWRLKGAGASSTDRMIVYTRDPAKVAAIVPIRLNMMPEERRGFSWYTYLESRTGGCVWYKPKSAVYRDAI